MPRSQPPSFGAAAPPIQQDDIRIAALCKQHDFVLATRDRGFESVLGLRLAKA